MEMVGKGLYDSLETISFYAQAFIIYDCPVLLFHVKRLLAAFYFIISGGKKLVKYLQAF